jgi:hypothetical protein
VIYSPWRAAQLRIHRDCDVLQDVLQRSGFLADPRNLDFLHWNSMHQQHRLGRQVRILPFRQVRMLVSDNDDRSIGLRVRVGEKIGDFLPVSLPDLSTELRERHLN